MGSRYVTHAAAKDSGVLWMGRIPEHWDVGKLAYIFTKDNAGEVIDKNFWGDGEELLYTCKRTPLLSDYSTFPERKRTTIKDLLLTRNGTPYIHLPEAGSIYSNVVQRIQLSERFDRGYCAYALSDAALNLRGYGVSIESFNFEMWKALNMCFPPLGEQKTIARFLDHETAKIDELIARQERLIELLKEKRQAVISHAVTKGLNPDVPMKDSGVEWLGEVPEHWEVLRIGNLFKESIERGGDELPVLSVSIHNGISDKELSEDESDRKISRSEDRSLYKRIRPLDLAYNMMRAWQGGFGACSVHGLVSPAYVVARPRRAIRTEYVELLLRTENAVEQMRRYSRGITDFRLRLYWDEFKNIRIVLPPKEEVDELLNHIASINDKYEALQRKAEASIELLKERRTALISAAVTGKIDVRGWVPE